MVLALLAPWRECRHVVQMPAANSTSSSSVNAVGRRHLPRQGIIAPGMRRAPGGMLQVWSAKAITVSRQPCGLDGRGQHGKQARHRNLRIMMPPFRTREPRPNASILLGWRKSRTGNAMHRMILAAAVSLLPVAARAELAISINDGKQAGEGRGRHRHARQRQRDSICGHSRMSWAPWPRPPP